jgi:hypothetical protein
MTFRGDRTAASLVGRIVQIFLLFSGFFLFFGCHTTVSTDAAAPTSLRLGVLVVFDQMRGDYLERWQTIFQEGGFRRLQTEGAWFSQAHLPYAWTSTGPGHASLATGCSPAVHGIIENDWYDRSAAEKVYCAAHDRYGRVPSLQSELGAGFVREDRGDGGPDRLLAPTIGEALKEATPGKGRVISLSHKDRAAVLMAGRGADGCYWLDERTGTFHTSTCYRDAVHPWVAAFNRGPSVQRWQGKVWDRLRPDLDYVVHSSPDDQDGEGTGYGQGRTFPHPFNGGGKRPKDYYRAVLSSPMGDRLLLELARAAVEGERLGQGSAPDLLCLSFSCNDVIGHSWGPDSQEMLDSMLRADLLVKELLAYLDEHVGKDRYFLVLAGDHGICPLLSVAHKQGKPTGTTGNIIARSEEILEAAYGKGPWIRMMSDFNLYLNHETIKGHGLKVEEVADRLARSLEQVPSVLKGYSAAQLQGGVAAKDEIGQRVARGYYPGRSGEVAVVLKPYHLVGWSGTNHGTPHPYDTHVAFVVYGPGIRKGKRPEPMSPLASAAILARALGVPPPTKAETGVPEGLFAD